MKQYIGNHIVSLKLRFRGHFYLVIFINLSTPRKLHDVLFQKLAFDRFVIACLALIQPGWTQMQVFCGSASKTLNPWKRSGNLKFAYIAISIDWQMCKKLLH